MIIGYCSNNRGRSVFGSLTAVKYVKEQWGWVGGGGVNCSTLTTTSKPNWSDVRLTSTPGETQLGIQEFNDILISFQRQAIKLPRLLY
jgi:hypothetical protein